MVDLCPSQSFLLQRAVFIGEQPSRNIKVSWKHKLVHSFSNYYMCWSKQGSFVSVRAGLSDMWWSVCISNSSLWSSVGYRERSLWAKVLEGTTQLCIISVIWTNWVALHSFPSASAHTHTHTRIQNNIQYREVMHFSSVCVVWELNTESLHLLGCATMITCKNWTKRTELLSFRGLVVVLLYVWPRERERERE